MNKSFKNILVIGHSNIGDVCYDLSIILPLKKHFPGCRISFLTSKRSKELACCYKQIDEVIIEEQAGSRVRLIRLLRKKGFDLLVITKFTYLNLFLFPAKALKIIKDPLTHPVLRYARMLKRFKVNEELEYRFNLSSPDLDFAKNFLSSHGVIEKDNLISIMPFSNWPLKCWPIESWNDLIDVLIDKYKLKVLILGRETADPYSKKVSIEISKRALSAVNLCSIPQSLALIKQTRAFVSSDSSLLHIASCMKIDSIGLYGPTVLEVYFPYFHKHLALKPQTAPECAPCSGTSHLGQCRKQGQADCMKAIKVEEVVDRLRQVLKLG